MTAFALAAHLGSAGFALGQVVAPSQVTPRDLRPPAAGPSNATIPVGQGPAAPANAANLQITIGNVSVEGGFPELQDETNALVAPIKGKRVSLSAVYAVADAIERAYALHAYVLVRVAVPPQKLTNGGTLRLVVIDGFVETVDVSGVPERERAVVSARTASLIGLRHVNLNEIERRLLLASDVPGQSLTSTLERGATPGGTKLVLETKQSYVTGSIGIDNDLPQSLRNFEWTGSLALNSLLGLGEQAYISGTAGYNLDQLFNAQSPIQVFGGGVLLPIGVDGFKINPEYTNSVTRPIPPAGTPQTTGYYQRFDLRASYPLLLTRAQAITVQGTYEWAEESLVANGFASDLYLDRYSAARLQLEDRLRLPWDAQADVTGVFSQGLGGRDAADAASSGVPLSQQGSSPTFSKLTLNANYSQPLPYDFQFALLGQGQASFGKPLFLAEQMALDGPQAASGYPVGTFTVDSGVTLRGEIGHSFAFATTDFQATLSPYVFGAAGAGWIYQPTAVQQGEISVGSFGLGIRTGAGPLGSDLGGTLSLEVARAVSNSMTQGQGYRCNVAFAVRF
jgi:hemolysin activation/secretion protein